METNNDQFAVFDIETAPLPEDQLKASMPDFKPAANLKDPEKIRASIEEKREAYIREAALSPLTGRVLAAGVRKPDGNLLIAHGEDEADILRKLVHQLRLYLQQSIPVAGFNIKFDLQFIRFRCAVHSIHCQGLISRWKGRAYWDGNFVDLMEEVVMGRERSGNSLDAAELARRISESYPKAAERVFVQEEPRNAGAYLFVSDVFRERLGVELTYIGRHVSATPAVGSKRADKAQQEGVIASAIGAKPKDASKDAKKK